MLRPRPGHRGDGRQEGICRFHYGGFLNGTSCTIAIEYGALAGGGYRRAGRVRPISAPVCRQRRRDGGFGLSLPRHFADRRRFAIQGTISVGHASGFYGDRLGLLDRRLCRRPAADAELDLIVGYQKTFGSTTIDAGVLYYYYPGSGGIEHRLRRALYLGQPHLRPGHRQGHRQLCAEAKGADDRQRQRGQSLSGRRPVGRHSEHAGRA